MFLHRADDSVRPPAELTHNGLDKSSAVYTAVSSYRASFRAQQIPPSYRAWKHFGLINVCGVAAALFTGWMAGGPVAMIKSPRSLAMMLLAFAFANGFEYYAHRFKLHNPLVHTRHSHTHHRFFTDKVSDDQRPGGRNGGAQGSWSRAQVGSLECMLALSFARCSLTGVTGDGV